MSYKPRTLFRLIEDINNSLYLPHIQRPFVWSEEQMVKLFDSLMRDYPIQTFLFWRTEDEIKARKFMEEIEDDPDLSDFYDSNKSAKGVEKTFVLDGQQRLQTLYAIFRGAVKSEDKMRREAYYDITSGDKIDENGILHRLKFSSDSLPLPWYRIPNLSGCDGRRNPSDLADNMNEKLDTIIGDETQDTRRDRERRVRRNISQLVSLLREEKYFWIDELDGVANEYSYKKILDIFVRVNSGGTRLDASDLMFAAMKEGWSEIEESIEDTTELLNNGDKLRLDKTFPLKCLLVVNGCGAEASPEKFTGERGQVLLRSIGDTWDMAEAAFQELRDFIVNDLKIYSDKVIRSYISLIPLFDYIYHNPKAGEKSRSMMRGYYYKSQLFGWYSKSTDSVVNSLHGIVGKPNLGEFPIDKIKSYFLMNNYQTQLQESHLKENRARLILLNLVYVDQMGGSPFDIKFKGNEPHIDHIYPRHACLHKLLLSSADVNHIGNYRFVGARDNIRKRAELPSSYFSRLKKQGIDISKHLLLDDYSSDPSKLIFDSAAYIKFRDGRFEKLLEISKRIVNPEG